ncbi:MAG: pectate lyase C, partial [Candidatus Latescibacteria bacterium]|nr:pectate lyase C [Candidatus Latescibacterota bacterium]
VSGVISLSKDLKIKNDNITIAGQTSPGGICLRGASTQVDANQVIIRYLRFRLGAVEEDSDAAGGRRKKDIILDHCSFSWSVDETASFYGNQNFTMQYCMVTESLNNSGHHKGSHGYGGIWGGSGASFHHNVLAHHRSRNPRINGHRLGSGYPQIEELTDVRNNVVYNWSSTSAYGAENGQFNFINNYYKSGPADGSKRFFSFYGFKDNKLGKGHVAGNILIGKPAITNDNSLGLKISNADPDTPPAKDTYLANEPFGPKGLPLFQHPVDHLTTHTAKEAYQLLIVKKEAGANRNASGLFQDEIDTRILNEIKTGTTTYGNGIIDTELTVIKSWEDYHNSFPNHSVPEDKDDDGLPDNWEKEKDISDPNAYDLSTSYTNIEIYFNELGRFNNSPQ